MSKRAAARKGVLARQDVASRSPTKSAKLKGRGERTPRRDAGPRASSPSPVARGVGAVLVLALALACVLAVVSFHAARPTVNLIGRAGYGLATLLFGAVGVCAFLVPFPLFSLGASLATSDPAKRHWSRLAALVVLALSGSVLAQLIVGARPGQDYPPGGIAGRFVGDGLELYLSFWGAVLATCAVGASALVVASEGWLVRAGVAAGRALCTWSLRAGGGLWARTRAAATALERHRIQRRKERLEEAAYMAQLLANEEESAQVEEDAVAAEEASDEADALAEVAERNRGLSSESEGMEPEAQPLRVGLRRAVPEEDPAWARSSAPPAPAQEKKRKGRATATAQVPAEPAVGAPAPEEPECSPLPKIVVAPKKEQEEAAPPPEALAPDPESAPDAAQAQVTSTPAIIERAPPPKPKKKPSAGFEMAAGCAAFTLPSVEMLDLPEEKGQLKLEKEIFYATAEKLRLKLKDFGIEGEVKEIHPGPVITMYEFVPGPGIKISKIASLADDLAMAMEALRVRIVAPIPGKGSVGIEVPNKEREIVFLREIAESEKYASNASKLTMCLGKNIEGMPYVMDLAKAPHLLMAGTTGSGKSVSVNAMIMSLLLKATPEEVRFLMVDPKMLELSIYEGIPHLLLPVVTDSKKAALALRWAVEEMERRYQLMSDVGVRGIAGYNKMVDLGQLPPPPDHRAEAKIVVDVREGVSEGALDAGDASAPAEAPPAHKKLPYIVVIIDELADLMMVASREVETSIARLAQMARAAGIHLMVATQRPSTDVVTGVIKANFPSRISFMLRSKPDSMTILGQTGAEALLGMGDMLVMPPTDSNVIRVHGAYVSEQEIKKVVDHWKAQGKPVYDESILQPRDEEGEGGEEDDLSDELYDQALAIVAEMREVSISVLQRKMRIGYNRSARMIERMERDGVVDSADGSKPRKVLIRPVGQMPGAGA